MISGVTSGCNQAEMCDIIGVTVIGRNSEHHVGEATFGTGVMIPTFYCLRVSFSNQEKF